MKTDKVVDSYAQKTGWQGRRIKKEQAKLKEGA